MHTLQSSRFPISCSQVFLNQGIDLSPITEHQCPHHLGFGHMISNMISLAKMYCSIVGRVIDGSSKKKKLEGGTEEKDM